MSGNTSNPIYGNYHGYYSKRPFVQDPRLALLPREIFQDSRVLDVGCNEGWVTCQIAQSWGARRVVGVDIDDTLIRAAWKRRRAIWSQQGPSQEISPNGTGIKRKKYNESLTEPTSMSPPEPEHFPASCEHMFGPIPIHSQSLQSPNFPHNCVFQTADWVTSTIAEDTEGYHVVIAFSISKWIHLNEGDEGLMRFFNRVYTVLKPGGAFVLEPQEWDTYGKAKRMDPKLKENAKTLEIRPKDFEEILTSIGFQPVLHLGKTGEGGFHRPVDLYRKS